MILLEEPIAYCAERVGVARRSLEEVLELRWRRYRKALKSCTKKFSEKSVHALRVEIRRMLSTLGLIEAVLPHELMVALELDLKDRLKALSRLRDTHVQIDAVAEMREEALELAPFQEWLKRRERRLIKRLERELDDGRGGKLGKRVSRLGRVLRKFAGSREIGGRVDGRLLAAAEVAFENVRARYQRLSPGNVAAVHQMRIAFKKFRYMAEALSAVLPGIPDRRLRAMQAYQSQMGQIQDIEMLLGRFDKFAQAKNLKKGFVRAFRQKLARRRTTLVKQFLATGERVLDFWPIPPPRRTQPGRTAENLSPSGANGQVGSRGDSRLKERG